MRGAVCLFGAAERGAIGAPLSLHSLEEVLNKLGEPPPLTEGIYSAVQLVLLGLPLIYFRVTEEGESVGDYKAGFKWLKTAPLSIMAVALPGVADPRLMQSALSLCHPHHCPLLVSEKELYDYFTVR